MGIVYNVSNSWLNTLTTNSLNGLITQNLVYAFDAARPLSYSGSGVTVNDLAGSTVVGTLTNGPTFNADNLGSIVFDGSNDYIALQNGANTYNPILLAQTCSVYAWIKTNSNKTNPILDDRTGGPANVGLRITDTGKLQYLQYDGQWNYYDSVGSSVLTGRWNHVVFTRANSSLGPVKMYLNGELNHTVTVTSPRNLSGGNMTHIGVSWSGGSFNGHISMLLVYSVEHSLAQITQQFNMHRKRYGI